MTEGRKGSAGDGRGRILPDGAGRQGVADKADAAAGRGGRKAWGGTYGKSPDLRLRGCLNTQIRGFNPTAWRRDAEDAARGRHLTDGMARLPATMSEGTESVRT